LRNVLGPFVGQEGEPILADEFVGFEAKHGRNAVARVQDFAESIRFEQYGVRHVGEYGQTLCRFLARNFLPRKGLFVGRGLEPDRKDRAPRLQL
jgi:hypothetical protein